MLMKRASRLVVERSSPGLDFAGEVSLTRQADKDACDINVIIKKCQKSGVVPFFLDANAMYGNFESGLDFHALMSRCEAAKQQFDLLPAAVRARFDHDAGKAIDWLSDPKNDVEAVKLGLKPKSVLPVDVPAPVTAPVAGGAPVTPS